MSEDIDIKLVLSTEILSESNGMQRRCRKFVHQAITAMLEASPVFQLLETKKSNESRFQQFLIQYPRHHDRFDSLRPHIQLEVTESLLLEPSISRSIHSLYAEVIKGEPEVPIFSCVTMETTASEKFVSLLRRTAAVARDSTQADNVLILLIIIY